MKYAIEVVPFGEYSDPRAVVELAVAAEESGWDGLFTWDHVAFASGIATVEPFVTLAAVAAATERIKIGTNVTVVPRRPPHVLAHMVAALDLLSGGRFILGAGAGGVDREMTAFGGPGDIRIRAEMFDEGLAVIDGLLSGEAVTHRGPNYTVDNVTLAPRPLQQPRPPIWIGGLSRSAMRRAARFDAWVLYCADQNGGVQFAPEKLKQSLEYLARFRTSGGAFDVAVNGHTAAGQSALVREYGSAGATWWLETLHEYRGSRSDLLRRIAAGPPKG
jgi:probable F420-dependent oxidoreductase